MSSGGKGGGQTSQVTIPKYIEDASKKNLARADYFGQIGYVPYYGPDVAALSPMEEQAMRGTGSAMQAFGLADQGYDPLAGMPQAQTFMGGLRGYSSGDLYDDALATLQERRPAQYDAMTGAFIDPITGEAGVTFTPEGSIGDSTIASVDTTGMSDDDRDMANDIMTGNYNFNREKLAGFLADLPEWSLLGGLGRNLQDQYQAEMNQIAQATSSNTVAMPSSNESRQSDALSSAGESWGAPTVGSQGGNVSRGYSYGGW